MIEIFSAIIFVSLVGAGAYAVKKFIANVQHSAKRRIINKQDMKIAELQQRGYRFGANMVSIAKNNGKLIGTLNGAQLCRGQSYHELHQLMELAAARNIINIYRVARNEYILIEQINDGVRVCAARDLLSFTLGQDAAIAMLANSGAAKQYIRSQYGNAEALFRFSPQNWANAQAPFFVPMDASNNNVVALSRMA